MNPLPRYLLLVLLTLGLASPAGVPSVAQPREAFSPRNANYRIDAELDVQTRTILGKQTVRWRNTGEQPTRELWFHLYWNGWRNDRATWYREAELGWSRYGDERKIEDWGWIEVDAAVLRAIDAVALEETVEAPERRPTEADAEEMDSADAPASDVVESEIAPAVSERAESFDGSLDLMPTMRFESPDDGNPHDRTVMVLTLPRAVAPGQTVEVELEFRARVAKTNARTGYQGDYYLIAHWFPKIGVFEDGAWNCHQFHAATEFYADYGVYDVRLTVPDGYTVGAGGRLIGREEQDGRKTSHLFRAEDVHGFAWTASPDFLERKERFVEPGLPPVEMRLLIQPEHQGQAERYFEATRAALKFMGSWYGAYVYDHLTIVDPAWGSRTGGMEYPTLFTGGTRKFSPLGGDSPEGVTIHEASHQFWYGMVANNEIEAAWMDEGLVSYSTARVLDAAYPPRVLVRRYLPLPGETWSPGAFARRFPGIEMSRWSGLVRGYRGQRLTSVPTVPTYRHFPGAARAVSYGKTSLWLATLERYLGWDVMQSVLSTYFQRYRFAHPKPEDLFAVFDEVVDQDLGWFFDQIHRDAVTFDYAVTSVSSSPAAVEGWVERDGELVYEGPPVDPDSELSFRTEVLVQRHGLGTFPVNVQLVFEDGSEIRIPWDGREAWKVFAVERPAKLDYAAVDPDHVLMLDVQRINNSRHLKSQARLPAVKWGSKWMIWMQDFLTTFSLFV